MSDVVLVTGSGGSCRLPVTRWMGAATAEELSVLGRVRPPVLDVGCGPGRHVRALNERGLPALGIEPAPHAVGMARERGCAVLERSIFDHVPGAGRWGSALLLDGNLGIGGDPVRLLRRLAELLRTDGRILVEVQPPGAPSAVGDARLEVGGTVGPAFPWAVVSVDDLADVAAAARLQVTGRWVAGGRWFAELTPVDPAGQSSSSPSSGSISTSG